MREEITTNMDDFSLAFESIAGRGEFPSDDISETQDPVAEETAAQEIAAQETADQEIAAEEVAPVAEETVIQKAADEAAEETAAQETAAEEVAPVAEETAAQEITLAAQKAADEAVKKAGDEAAQKVNAEAAQKAADEAAQKAADEAAQRVEAEKFTDDEKTIIGEVVENFPEVAKAFDAIQRTTIAKMENIFEKKMQEVASQFDQKIAPALATTQLVAANSHESAIYTKHPDARDILPAVEKWVESQPAILQQTYNTILDNGDANQVIGMLDIYKESIKPANIVDTPAKIAKDKEKEEKLRSQEGVRTRHTSQAAVDPDDFAGAFEKYASK